MVLSCQCHQLDPLRDNSKYFRINSTVWHSIIAKDEDIILFGGINGINNLPNKNVFLINLQSNSIIETNKKCDADKNPMMFLRNNNSVYYQEKNSKKNFNVIFDHDLTVHNIYLDNLDFTKYKPN